MVWVGRWTLPTAMTGKATRKTNAFHRAKLAVPPDGAHQPRHYCHRMPFAPRQRRAFYWPTPAMPLPLPPTVLFTTATANITPTIAATRHLATALTAYQPILAATCLDAYRHRRLYPRVPTAATAICLPTYRALGG